MTGEHEVSQLLLRWRELSRQGKATAPEDLCKDAPDLLEELKRRIAAVQAMEQMMGVGASRGPSGGTDTMAAPENGTGAAPSGETPTIPGYELLGMLGQGGMGVVYRARQEKLKRLVAVKMIRGDFHPRPQQMARFWGEAEAVAHLQHPHIIQVYEFGEVSGRPYFSMELIEGNNLAQKLGGNPIDPREAAEITATLADAIHFAHGRGIVHRDLKPANVLVTPEGHLKITDFGLAKRLYSDSGSPSMVGGQTQSGVVLGTPSYMAPEQAAGKSKNTGPLADVYALGALLYEMLTGKPPFVGESPLDTLMQVLADDPVPPSKQHPQVPRSLETICLKCLEKSPGRRYSTAADLAADLRRFLNGEAIAARTMPPWRRVARGARQRPRLVALLTVLIVGAGLWLGWLGWRNHQETLIAEQKAEELRQEKARLAPRARELLHRYCYECHGLDPKRIAAGVNVLDYQSLRESPKSLLIPGDPEGSLLIHRVGDDSMPPEKDEEYARLSGTEKAELRRWVEIGAPAFPSPSEEPLPVLDGPPSALAAEVKTILSNKCWDCHRYGDTQNGIKILNHDLLLVKRHLVIPGDPDHSLLVKVLRPETATKFMPPRDEGFEPLTDAELATVRRWIAEGAPPFVRVRAPEKKKQ